MHDAKTTITAFLDGAAARQPTPGGGSVTALVGALSAAMGEMVMNYSVGKKGTETRSTQLKEALAEFHRARQLLSELMVEDQLAYEELSRLQKLPEDALERREKSPTALLACIRVPQAVAAAAVAIIELAGKVADNANVYLLSDLAVCADLATAALRCAIYNVRVNLKDLPDAGDRAAIEAAMSQLLMRGVMLIQQVSPKIWERQQPQSRT